MEEALAKPKRPPKAKCGKRGRRRKDDPPAPLPEPKRLQQQLERDLEANLADLPKLCDWGCKKNSQVAIPLAQLSAERIVNLYDLAAAAYDAKEIREMSARLGHVAIIEDNPGRGEKREFSPAEAVRYRQRSAVERVNAHLHEQHERREGCSVPENLDFLPSDGAKTVTRTESTIFTYRTPRGARLQAGSMRGSASASHY